MIKQYFFACIMVFALVACSRNGDVGKVSVTIPASNLMHQRNSAMATTPPLQSVIVNVRPVAGGTPQVIHQDYKSSVVSDLTFEFDGVPTGDILVQVLAVYANTGGGMQIAYGDTTIAFPTVSSALVTLGSTNITKQTYLAGRVQLSGGSYPTGTLVASFTPGTGKPAMVVDSKPIVSGWFNIFAVNGTGAAFDYILKETGTQIFTGLNPNLSTDAAGVTCTATSLSGGCPFSQFAQDRLKVSKPASYSHNGDITNSLIQANSPTDYVLGFFGNLSGGTRNVCYANDVYEAIPRIFADATLSQPLEVKFTSGTSAQVTVAGGGNSSFSSAALYTNGATSVCDSSQLASGHALTLNHTLLGDSDENFGGFNSPWMMVQPFNQNGNQYVSVVTNPAYNTTATFASGATTATLNAAFTPLVGSTITGTGISATITAVTTSSAGVYAVTLSTATSASGSSQPVTLQQPYAQLQWSLLPGIAFTYSSLSLSSSSTSVNVPTIAEPIVQGLYVRDQTNPSAIANGTTVSSVTGTSPYVVSLSGTPTTAGTDTLSFSYISGVEVWARPIYNGQATTNGSTDVVISPAYATSALVGQPISGDNIPSNATVVAVVDSSHITISAVATGSTTNGRVMIGNSSYGGGKDDCTALSSQGFILVTPNGVDPAVGKYSFSGLSGLPVGSNVGYQFALCAAVGTGTTKTYLGSYVTGQPAWSGDDNRWPFGWANSTKINATAVDPIADLGITSAKLSSISFPNPGLTQLTTAASLSTTANDEVMISIAAHGVGATDCGPGNYGAGAYTFARVLSASSTTIVIPSGTWVDQLALANLSGTMATGGNFCYVQVTRVAQYRNLTFASGLTNSSNAAVAQLLGSESIVPIRVNGTLNLSGTALLSGTGYLGGVYSTAPNGAGDTGPYSSSSSSTGKGGRYASAGGGGAGYGAGGAAAIAGLGGLATSYYNNDGLLFSLGGGGGSGSSTNGGAGGGALMLAAFNLSVGSGVSISEDGMAGSGFSGGGGGGSINLIANTVTGSSALTLSAQGGSGGTSGGGSGGGGFVSAMACTSSIAINPVVNAGTPGTSASAGGPGLSEINYSSTLSSKRWCY